MIEYVRQEESPLKSREVETRGYYPGIGTIIKRGDKIYFMVEMDLGEIEGFSYQELKEVLYDKKENIQKLIKNYLGVQKNG